MQTKHPRTALAWDSCFTEHVLQPGHPESPERLRAVMRALRRRGIPERTLSVTPVDDPYPHIRRIHSRTHIESVKALSVTGRVAASAAGHVVGAVRDVCTGRAVNAFCAVRPPGHHAHNNGGNFDGPGQGQGFCFYNNIAVGAAYAAAEHGCSRILIVDWDFHHGNGTEWAFSGNPGILFISTHHPFSYPGHGHETGAGNCINVHCGPGTSGDAIIGTWEQQLAPRLADFRPQLLLLSAGFDSMEYDPLGCFAVTVDGYRNLTGYLTALADRYCGGRMVSVLEGGYDPENLAEAVAGHVESLIGAAG